MKRHTPIEHMEKMEELLEEMKDDAQAMNDLYNMVAAADMLVERIFDSQLEVAHSPEGRLEWLRMMIKQYQNLCALKSKHGTGRQQ